MPETTIDIPLPWQYYDGAVVVASCWQNDDPATGALTATLLLLHPDPEHYSVVEVAREHDEWERTYAVAFPNIIPATEHYSDQIGGY